MNIKRFLKKVFSNLVKIKNTTKYPSSAVVIPRSKHNISRQQISRNALNVLNRLKKQGHSAYLVGGGVRDILLGREPKDFDVVTNAVPEEIKKYFNNGRLIGRRFPLVHVLFRGEIVEVSTFRAAHDEEDEKLKSEHGMILRDNAYGTIEEDALRRDFTINALYYNIEDFSLVDFHHGLLDLKQGVLRLIGDPVKRYREDPVRILRAVRFAAKLGFRIHESSEKPIFHLHNLLSNVSPSRLYTEVIKLFMSGIALETFKLLRHYGLFVYLFPLTENCLATSAYETINLFITNALEDTDKRIAENKPVTPGYLFSALLWFPLQEKISALEADGRDRNEALQLASYEILQKQAQYAPITKYYATTMRSIWELQERFAKRKRIKLQSIMLHPRFKAAYDFLLLRARADDSLLELSQWWQDYYAGDEIKRSELIKTLEKSVHKKRKKRKVKKIVSGN